MNTVKNIVLCIGVLFAWHTVFSNVAMPGFWGNGSGSNFFPLVAADSAQVGKIQMRSEEITVLLYPGFAVVKGVYRMYNHTSDTISITTGYPINGSISNDEVYAVSVSDLFALKVLIDNTEVPVKREDDNNNIAADDMLEGANNWYVWQTAFPPQAITTIQVYFMVNTSNAVLRKGYGKKKGNAFTYILESGRAWRDSIDSGNIRVFFKGGLRTADLIGIYPRAVFSGNDTFIHYHFEKLEPAATNNIILWHKAKSGALDFEKQLSLADDYYALADRILPPSPAAGFKVIDAYNFRVSNFGAMAIGALFTLTIIGPLLAGIIILAVIIFLVLRYFKRKTNPT